MPDTSVLRVHPGARTETPLCRLAQELGSLSGWRRYGLGFVLGAASGLMGIGGGVLFMPVLLYGFGLSVRNAAGTGILLLFVTVMVGTVEQALHGYVSLGLAMAILVGSSVGSQLGALTTHFLPNRLLRLIFAGLVTLATATAAWDLAAQLTG